MAENEDKVVYPGIYPAETPISKMVSADLAPALEAYSNITKADLMSMHGYGTEGRVLPSEFGLTTSDVHTIREVFTAEAQLDEVRGHLQSESAEASISCCCCTPCCSCCAASQDDPFLN